MPSVLQSDAFRRCQESRVRIEARLRLDKEQAAASSSLLSPKSMRSPMRVRTTMQVVRDLDTARLGLECALEELHGNEGGCNGDSTPTVDRAPTFDEGASSRCKAGLEKSRTLG